jgi:hypothetical protein
MNRLSCDITCMHQRSSPITYYFPVFQLYIQHMKNKQPDVTRKLLLTTKSREPPSFTKCFHGWSKYKSLALNLEKKIIPRMIE